ALPGATHGDAAMAAVEREAGEVVLARFELHDAAAERLGGADGGLKTSGLVGAGVRHAAELACRDGPERPTVDEPLDALPQVRDGVLHVTPAEANHLDSTTRHLRSVPSEQA